MTYSDGKWDKFYTKHDVAKSLINVIDLKKYDHIIEPSAGNGSFFAQINHDSKIGLDIFPESDDILKCDWFKYRIDEGYENVAIIGNPPFGKRNTISVNFINHAISFPNVKMIGFILPNVFKKYTLQEKISNEMKISKIMDLPSNSFFNQDGDVDIPCSFFIFERESNIDLRQKKVIETDDFKFVTKHEKFDYFIFGSAPKNLISYRNRNTINEKNRGYYIKTKIPNRDFLRKIKSVPWKGHSSVNGGVYWLTKVDIVQNYNEHIQGVQNE